MQTIDLANHRFETPLASYRIGFVAPARNRKNKKKENYRKRPPPETIFFFFPIFWGRLFPIVILFFPISVRRPEAYSVAGQRGLNHRF